MKKIGSMLVALLCSSLVFANGTVESTSGTSSVAVTNLSGSSVFKLYYKSASASNVKVSILNSSRSIVFSELIKKSEGFSRPYNFEGLSEGDYTIEIEDVSGKMVEKVRYEMGKVEKLVKVTKVSGVENKFLLTVASRKSDFVAVKIFDRAGKILLNESYRVNGEFAQLYNLKEISDFTIEVEDSSGILKSISY